MAGPRGARPQDPRARHAGKRVERRVPGDSFPRRDGTGAAARAADGAARGSAPLSPANKNARVLAGPRVHFRSADQLTRMGRNSWLPSRSSRMATVLDPFAVALRNSAIDFTTLPFTPRMTSPGRTPAWAAG